MEWFLLWRSKGVSLIGELSIVKETTPCSRHDQSCNSQLSKFRIIAQNIEKPLAIQSPRHCSCLHKVPELRAIPTYNPEYYLSFLKCILRIQPAALPECVIGQMAGVPLLKSGQGRRCHSSILGVEYYNDSCNAGYCFCDFRIFFAKNSSREVQSAVLVGLSRRLHPYDLYLLTS